MLAQAVLRKISNRLRALGRRDSLLADVGDGAALVRHCLALLSDPERAKAMGAAGRANIIANFQKTQLGQRYLRAVDKGAVLAGATELA